MASRLVVTLTLIGAIMGKPDLALDDVTAVVGEKFEYQVGDEKFLSTYKIYRLVERGQRRMPDWLNYDTNTSLLTGMPKTADLGSYIMRLRAECIDPTSCQDKLSRTFHVKVVEPLKSAESRGSQVVHMHVGIDQFPTNRKNGNRQDITDDLYINNSMSFDTSTDTVYSMDHYRKGVIQKSFLKQDDKRESEAAEIASEFVFSSVYLVHEISVYPEEQYIQDTNPLVHEKHSIDSKCSSSAVSYFTCLLIHLPETISYTDVLEQLLKQKLASFISKSVDDIYIRKTDIETLVSRRPDQHILTAGPGNVIESMTNSLEITWHLACDHFDHINDYTRVIQHNIDVGRVSSEIGYDIIAWFVFTNKPVSRQQKRQANGNVRRTSTPTFTPGPPSSTSEILPTATIPSTSFLEPTVTLSSTYSSVLESLDSVSVISPTSMSSSYYATAIQTSSFSSNASIVPSSASESMFTLLPSYSSYTFSSVFDSIFSDTDIFTSEFSLIISESRSRITSSYFTSSSTTFMQTKTIHTIVSSSSLYTTFETTTGLSASNSTSPIIIGSTTMFLSDKTSELSQTIDSTTTHISTSVSPISYLVTSPASIIASSLLQSISTPSSVTSLSDISSRSIYVNTTTLSFNLENSSDLLSATSFIVNMSSIQSSSVTSLIDTSFHMSLNSLETLPSLSELPSLINSSFSTPYFSPSQSPEISFLPTSSIFASSPIMSSISPSFLSSISQHSQSVYSTSTTSVSVPSLSSSPDMSSMGEHSTSAMRFESSLSYSGLSTTVPSTLSLVQSVSSYTSDVYLSPSFRSTFSTFSPFSLQPSTSAQPSFTAFTSFSPLSTIEPKTKTYPSASSILASSTSLQSTISYSLSIKPTSTYLHKSDSSIFQSSYTLITPSSKHISDLPTTILPSSSHHQESTSELQLETLTQTLLTSLTLSPSTTSVSGVSSTIFSTFSHSLTWSHFSSTHFITPSSTTVFLSTRSTEVLFDSSVSLLSMSILPSSSSFLFESSSTTAMETSSPITTAPPDQPPSVDNSIDHLNVMVGRYFHYSIPEKTFLDKEDGSTRNLSLDVSLVDGEELQPGSWLMFDPTQQILYGIPFESDIHGSDNELMINRFILIATDSQGQSAKDVISVTYKTERKVTHEIMLNLNSSYYGTFNRSYLIQVAKTVAKFYNDENLNYFTFFEPPKLSLTRPIKWGNNSLFGDKCLREDIQSLFDKLVHENDTVVTEFAALFPDDPVLSVDLFFSGVCTFPVTTLPLSTKSPITETDNDKMWIEIVLPALIAILVIVIIALLLLICCRHSRPRKHVPDSNKPMFLEDRRPIIFPEELELMDPSLKPKDPLILPSDYLQETPPAVPPHGRPSPPYRAAPPLEFPDEPDIPPLQQPQNISARDNHTDPPPYRLPPPYFNPHRLS